MGKNLPFIEFFYKYAPAFPAPKSLFFIDSIFSYHSFTPSDFQRITVNPPVFPFTLLSPYRFTVVHPLFLHISCIHFLKEEVAKLNHNL
jgi:hypothetical protein